MKQWILLLVIALSQISISSEVTDILPVTDQILSLHFDDGYVEHYGLGESGNQDQLHRSPLSIRRATDPASYTITSTDDANYSTGQKPTRIGRKSKGKDFTSNWGSGLPFVLEHTIYLELETPLQNGKTYTISLGNLAKAKNTFEIVFDTKQLRSETIHVNQIGYAPASPQKWAYLSHWMGDLGPLDLNDYSAVEFHVYDLDQQAVVWSNEIRLRKDLESGGPDCAYDGHAPFGSYTGADVWVLDFTEFDTPGNYKIVVDRIGCSFPFRIESDVYREAYYTVTRALYHQRCGMALEAPYTQWTRDRCHHPAETDTVVLSDWRYMDGRNAFDELPQFATDIKKPYWGGWHDAADWDKHHFHMKASRYLMLVYEMRPDHFPDDELNIPESGNGLPDILDVARWSIDFYKSMQEDDGGIHGGIETHRHPGTGISSVTDTDQWYAYAPDPIASFHYAAAACQLALCLNIAGDIEEEPDYVTSAKQAYVWALDNTGIGEWDEQKLRDMRQLAAAWLFKITGEEEYQEQFKTDNKITSSSTDLEVWQSHDQQWAVWTYVMTDQPTIDQALKSRLINAVEHWAYSDHIDNADRRGYQYGNDWWMPIAWGQATRPRVFPVTVAYHITGDRKYLRYHYTTVDYILGANPLNMCWATQLGDKHPQEIMHLDSWYYNQELGMTPGFIPYGPTSYQEGDAPGPWDVRWGLKTTYPHASEWPSHELYFENRYCPQTNEFTVHEQIGPAAAAFAYLTAPGGTFTDVSMMQKSAPHKLYLNQNYPNPFNHKTSIRFELSQDGVVRGDLYDLSGRLVKTLFDRHFSAGSHMIRWSGDDDSGASVASGLYYARINHRDQVRTIKMLLLK